MSKKILYILGLGYLLSSTPIFSDESLVSLSFLEYDDAENIRNAVDHITNGEVEDTLSFEKYFDLLNPLMALSKENRTKCFIVALSNIKSREYIAFLALNERTLQFALTELKNKSDFLSSLIDKELLKLHLKSLATSLDLDGTSIEYHINEEDYGQLFYDLEFF